MNDSNIITIKREFDAPVETVWEVWTNPEYVKKWWGPEGFYAPSIKSDFKEGGMYVYAMHGPKDTEFDKDMYSAGIYKKIVPMKKIEVTDYFSDENGNKMDPAEAGMGNDMPSEMEAVVTFDPMPDDKTELTISYKPDDGNEYEAMKISGMEDGWNQSLDKFEDVLKSM